jgi:hypothetical protein
MSAANMRGDKRRGSLHGPYFSTLSLFVHYKVDHTLKAPLENSPLFKRTQHNPATPQIHNAPDRGNRKLSNMLSARFTCSSMDDAAQPAKFTTREWTPVDVTAHNRRAHAFAQTGTILSFKTRSLSVTSSRGFGRELPPMGHTRPSLTGRRYTIDASLATRAFQEERDYAKYDYKNLRENFSYPTQPSAKVNVSLRETDEPVQRRIQLTLPDPLRYRDLHRWGRVWPHDDGGGVYCHVGDGLLTNEDFYTIMDLKGNDCWYRDNVLDVALQLSSIYHEANEHSIAVASIWTVQAVHVSIRYGRGISELQAYIPMLTDKKWVFVPLNDGIGHTSAEDFVGTHWSLLVIDRPNKRAHYIDGLGNGMEHYARQFASTFQKMLGDEEEYNFIIESNAPHQWDHNRYPSSWDVGPCGPYVVKMIHLMLDHIRKCQQDGEEISFSFGPDMSSYFNFNSFEERWSLVFNLASVKASEVAEDRTTKHDDIALGLSRPLGYTGFRNPAWSTYDAPLLDFHNSLTARKLARYNELRALSHDRNNSIDGQSSSGSSGGISINSGASGTHGQSANNQAQDSQLGNEVNMHHRLDSIMVNADDEVRGKEVSEDEHPSEEILIEEVQRSPSLDPASSPIYNSPQSIIHGQSNLRPNGPLDGETIHYDRNTQHSDDQRAATWQSTFPCSGLYKVSD